MRFLRFPSCSNINICNTHIQIQKCFSFRGVSPPEPPSSMNRLLVHARTRNARTRAFKYFAHALSMGLLCKYWSLYKF